MGSLSFSRFFFLSLFSVFLTLVLNEGIFDTKTKAERESIVHAKRQNTLKRLE
jgi:hypothetical protein